MNVPALHEARSLQKVREKDEGSHSGVKTTGEPSLGSLVLALCAAKAHGNDRASSNTA